MSFSLSKGASIHVMGPQFHGSVSFDVGPVGLTVPFGGATQSSDIYISWTDFVRKYLEEASPGVARVITAMPGKGSLPPGTGTGGATDTATADGSAERPFEVFSEFEITVTTLVPTVTLSLEGADETHLPSGTLGIAPMNVAGANSVLELGLVGGGNPLGLRALVKDIQEQGSFPVGVWGLPQPTDDRKVPKGDVITALNAVRFEAVAALVGTLPKEIAYDQIDPPGPRKPLPFLSSAAARPRFSAQANAVSGLLPSDAPGAVRTFAIARTWMAGGGTGKTALAALERERTAPPRLGTLTQGLAAHEQAGAHVSLPARTPPFLVDRTVHPPEAIAVLTPAVQAEQARLRTTGTRHRAAAHGRPDADLGAGRGAAGRCRTAGEGRRAGRRGEGHGCRDGQRAAHTRGPRRDRGGRRPRFGNRRCTAAGAPDGDDWPDSGQSGDCRTRARRRDRGAADAKRRPRQRPRGASSPAHRERRRRSHSGVRAWRRGAR